ncbi:MULTISPECIES: hypothetical protein [unclassified Exiguobacterium]|uniref:hypothetical protein n=1 Tax=unclassified Exiguobacterium TaxID=2644629 RepID=UPI001BE5FA89|nr:MULTISPECIES: hypothetical protein [unclassified Exiguobacterium]
MPNMFEPTLLQDIALYMSGRITRAAYLQDGNEYNADIVKNDVSGTKLNLWVNIPANTTGISQLRFYDENDVRLLNRPTVIVQRPGRPTYARIEIDTKEMSL